MKQNPSIPLPLGFQQSVKQLHLVKLRVREVLTMWELMNGMAGTMRNRWMPRRSTGMGTMTAVVLGASVGIAAWETFRRTRMNGNVMGMGAAGQMAEQVMNSLNDES
jgi:hypothetical protein